MSVLTDLVSTHPRRSGTVAPQWNGRGWLNTGGADILPDGYRGRVLLLHFWSSCSASSLSVLESLRRLQARFGDEIAVVGVHSPKFEHQSRSAALTAACERAGIRHPVLDDADLETWRAYGVTAWPTLVLVDPEGRTVAHLAGTSHAPLLENLVADVLDDHRARGTLHPAAATAEPSATRPGTALRHPGKLLRLPRDRPLAHPTWGGAALVSDTVHAQLVVLAADLETELGRIGTGVPGHVDGGPGTARFVAPQGVELLPAPVALAVGYDVVVADPGAHALRGVRLADGAVRTLGADTPPTPAPGAPGTVGPATGALLRPGRSSVTDTPPGGLNELTGPEGFAGPGSGSWPAPWDVAWFDGFVVVAMAGLHQLWAFVPAADPREERLAVLAGSGTEGLVDGLAGKSWFAQPSGLSVSSDGQTLWVTDAQSSALRWLRRGLVGGYEVGTAVGRGLWEYGFRDGRRHEALMQHPQGVAALPDGSVVVADTYNGALRRFDPRTGRVATLAADLDEPTAVAVDGDRLLVVESGAHRLRRVLLGAPPRRPPRLPPLPRPPSVVLAPGAVHVAVEFGVPDGHELDDRFGAPTWLSVAAEPPDLLVSGSGSGPGLDREVAVADPSDGGHAEGVLHVTVHAATHRGTDEAEYVQDWGIPIHVVPGGDTALSLDLRRTAAKPSRSA